MATDTPVRELPDTTDTAATRIDRQTTIDGTLSTESDLIVEGIVRGTVTCQGIMHVAQDAEVDATVAARGIVVAGSLNGAITCNGLLEIRSSGVVHGEVETERLVVQEGAIYEGRLKMDPASRPATAPDESAEAEAPVQAASSSSFSFLRSFSTNPPASESGSQDLPASADDKEPS
jgi:cytoskeletal protein CcmA (bactofilin family)